jgi:hypothetical protein
MKHREPVLSNDYYIKILNEYISNYKVAEISNNKRWFYFSSKNMFFSVYLRRDVKIHINKGENSFYLKINIPNDIMKNVFNFYLNSFGYNTIYDKYYSRYINSIRLEKIKKFF